MEFPSAPRPAGPPPFWPRRGKWLAVGALLLYAGFLACFVDANAGGADSSGYFNHARLLASGHVHVAPRAVAGLPAGKFSNFLYAPLGLKPAPHGDGLVPTYPTGLPLLILAANPLGGWRYAGDIVLVVHALAGILLTYALARQFGVARRWAVLGTVLLGASPLYLYYSLQTMSDLPALVWATAAALAAWRARRQPRWALAAGAALALAVLIRPNNLLMAAPIGVAWWPADFSGPRLRTLARQVVRCGLGGLPGGLFFCLHSSAAYGHPFTTGYGDTGVLFETQYVRQTLLHYVHWLPAVFSPLICLAVLLPWAARESWRAVLFLGGWALAYLAFYVSYGPTHETWWYLRFLLPAAPALIVGSTLVADRLARIKALAPLRLHTAASAAFIVLAAVLVSEEAHLDRDFKVVYAGRNEGAYAVAAQWMKANVPADAILAVMQTSGAMYYYTDFALVRWDQIEPEQFKLLLAAAGAARRPIYAPLFDFEIPQVMARMPGPWKLIKKLPRVSVWQWAGPAASP